ncbi:ABC transporter ATP-binding protein [Streptomyces subrutilus]|uniref:ABC transporter ATP-binding protein n=1 Tax=Streptomyces subrutilus TaxID=36818 RepID=A0A5P2UMK7_9ACTN|nr:ABC transporter ATP-binding protein [Streptomyces subrutilus]QEU79629.1 ABC transporter ATP-binding protein [Streptomyces subrutilus]WSJ31123.1 ABC transporter ATP-binding protein [Streptomyces subrutilus]
MPPAPTAHPVSVRGLSKRYGDVQAVRDISLDIHRGEVFALLGPNGAGKTTTVDILTGVQRRTGGDVRVLGCDPAEDPREWRAKIGVVPQTSGAYSDLTVKEVVTHFAAMYPAPLPVGEVLGMVGLGSLHSRQASALSGGQQRRLDVAVGVVGDPELIFLDEPTTGLDPVARREAWELVRYFADRGRTTVLTTHYLDEAEELAQRAGVVVGGRLVEYGPLASFGGRDQTPSTVSFRRGEALAGVALPALPPGTEVVPSGPGTVTLRTAAPSHALSLLLPWAREAGSLELADLRVHRPTLEEIYLNLIDRESRETAA